MKTAPIMTLAAAAVIAMIASGCTDPQPQDVQPLGVQSPPVPNETVKAPVVVPPTPAVPSAEPLETPDSGSPSENDVVGIKDTQEEPEAAPGDTDPQLVETEGVMLGGITLATGVDKRQPIAPGTSFQIGAQEKIYAILDVKNPSQEESTVTVSWLRPGSTEAKWGIEVTVGPQKNWRTWAFTRNATKPGRWTVQITDADGTVIGTAPFTMTE